MVEVQVDLQMRDNIVNVKADVKCSEYLIPLLRTCVPLYRDLIRSCGDPGSGSVL